MNTLVPEARVNKNGVSVIKHVRPDASANAATSNRIPKLSLSDTNGRKVLGQQLVNLIFTIHNRGDHVVLVDAYGNDDGNEYELKHVYEAVDEMLAIGYISYAVQSVLCRETFSKLEYHLIGEQFYERVYEYCSNLEAGERTQEMSSREIYQTVDCLILARTAVDFTTPGNNRIADALRGMHKASSAFYRRGTFDHNADEPEYADGLRFAYLFTELTGETALPEWVHRDEVLDTSIERNVELRETIAEVNANYDLIKDHQDVCRERKTLDIGLLKLVDESSTPSLSNGLL